MRIQNWARAFLPGHLREFWCRSDWRVGITTVKHAYANPGSTQHHHCTTRYGWKTGSVPGKQTRSCPDKHSQVLFPTLKQWFLTVQYHNPILLSDAPQLLSPHGQQHQRAGLSPLSALAPAKNPDPRAKGISVTGAKDLTWTDVPLFLLCVRALQLIFRGSSCSSEIFSSY